MLVLAKAMQAIDQFRPGRALGFGVLLSAVNPKNLLLTVGAAVAIAQTGIGAGQQAAALAVFIVVATLGVGGPLSSTSGSATARERRWTSSGHGWGFTTPRS